VLAGRARLAVRDLPVQSDAHAAGDHPPGRAGLGANACTGPDRGDRSCDHRWHRWIDNDWLDHRYADERNDRRYDRYDGHSWYSDTDRPARNQSGARCAGSTGRSVQSSAGYARRGHDDQRTGTYSCADDDEATSGSGRDNVAADDGGDDAGHHTTADHTRADHHRSADHDCGSTARNDGSANHGCARTATTPGATTSRATASTGSGARSRARAT